MLQAQGGAFGGYQHFGGAATDAPQQALRGAQPPGQDRPSAHDVGWPGAGAAAQQPSQQQQRAGFGTGLVRKLPTLRHRCATVLCSRAFA